MRLLPLRCQCSWSCPATLILQPPEPAGQLTRTSRPTVAISHSKPRFRLLRHVAEPACQSVWRRQRLVLHVFSRVFATALRQQRSSCSQAVNCHQLTAVASRIVMMMLGRQCRTRSRDTAGSSARLTLLCCTGICTGIAV